MHDAFEVFRIGQHSDFDFQVNGIQLEFSTLNILVEFDKIDARKSSNIIQIFLI